MCSYSLDQKEHVYCCYGVFKVHASSTPARLKEPPAAVTGNAQSFKTQQRGYDEVDVFLGETDHRTIQLESWSINGPAGLRSQELRFP